MSLPMGISYILSLILAPVIPWLNRLKINKTASVSILLIFVGFFTIFPIVKVAPLIQREIGKLDQYIPKVESFIEKDYKKYNQLLFDKTGVRLDDRYVKDSFEFIKQQLKNGLLQLPKFLASLFEWIILVPFFLFFFLRDHQQLRNLFLSFTPNVLFERFYFLTHEFNRKLGDYIFAKFVEASLIGIIITVGLSIMGVNFWLIWGILAAITNIIPYVGPFLGMLPAVVVSLVEYGVGPTFWGVVILFAVANIIDLAIVFPILVSKIVDLHPLLVVVSVIIGSQLFGIVGMVVSIPLAAAAKLLIIEIYKEIYLTASK
jgi:putative permease